MYYFHPFWSTNHSLQSLLLSLLFYYLFHRFIIHSYFYWYWIHHDVFYYSSSYSLTDKAKCPDRGTPAGVEIAVAFDIETAGCPTKKQILSFVSAAVAGDATDEWWWYWWWCCCWLSVQTATATATEVIRKGQWEEGNKGSGWIATVIAIDGGKPIGGSQRQNMGHHKGECVIPTSTVHFLTWIELGMLILIMPNNI